jgi:hypothetical protein
MNKKLIYDPIEIGNLKKETIIELSDAHGTLVMKLSLAQMKLSIDLNFLEDGMYVLSIKNDPVLEFKA